MKRFHLLIGGIVVLIPVAFGVWHLVRAALPAPSAPPPVPVASVTTVPVAQSVLKRRIATFGEIGAGQVLGISFARGGQLTRLATTGRHVARGAVLASLAADPATLQSYQQAVAAVDLARREWQRQQELLKLQLATQSQVDITEKAYRDAVGNVKALDQTGGGTGESIAIAPYDGVVLSVSGALGDRVAAGAPILQFGHTDVLKVLIGVDPVDRWRVQVGTPVQVTPLVGLAADVPPIAAKVGEVQDAIDPKTMLVTAIVYLRGVDVAGLVPGMRVRASLEVGSETATAVPRNAVLTDEKGSYVFQVANGKAQRVEVKTGLQSDGLVAITGIRDASLPIVAEGNYELEDGMSVKVGMP